jgi:guanylate kinase
MAAAQSRRGLLIILSSPSGAGKSTLARRLMDWDPSLRFSVSATTRPPRPGEVDGEHYHFLSEPAFKALVADGAMLEHAHVFGHFYGSPKAPVQAAIEAGKDVLFDIDWQGAQQLTEKMPGDVVRVFVLPPSGKALEDRLRQRAQDPPEVVARRMAAAAAEISHWPEYDYVVVNTDVEESVRSVIAVLHAERLKRARLLGLSDFTRSLQDGL